MMQESVYIKLALNGSVVESVKRRLRQNAPPDGLVQMLVITEKQFCDIEYVVGTKNSDVVDSPERFVII